MRTDEEIRHDRINLPRLMKRLEQAVQDDDWAKTTPPKRETWVKAQAMLQQIRHAKLLLSNVELDSVDLTTPAQERRYQHFSTTLQRLEDYMRQVEQQSTPPVRRPKALLPTIRPPTTTTTTTTAPHSPPPRVEAILIPAEVSEPEPSSLLPPDAQDDLLPASPDIASPTPSRPLTLIPTSALSLSPSLTQARAPSPSPSPIPAPGAYPTSPSSSKSTSVSASTPAPPTTSTLTASSTLLQNTRPLHEELSSQLAIMATQLRLNATYFSQSLEKDRAVVDAVQTKLERNSEQVQHERIRLHDFRGKSGGTTCLVITSVIIVLIAFVVMVFIIRLT